MHTSLGSRVSFPSLLGKVARSAGWGVARRINFDQIARTSISPSVLAVLLRRKSHGMTADATP